MAIFKLTIELGNDAMQTENDVARVMREWIRRNTGQGSGAQFSMQPGRSGVIRDENGNKVGRWEVEP
jgi:hypothetical protein